jgi:hypothetical protein
MKIHSDIITFSDIFDAVPDGCYLANFMHQGREVFIGREGSRSREAGYVVRLSGSSKFNMHYLLDKAATYDEWGFFLAALYAKDENAICGNYKNGADFDLQTQHAFPITIS